MAGTATLPTSSTAAQSGQSRSGLLLAVGMIGVTLLASILHLSINSADTAVYFDLSDALRHGHWQALINSYWFPLYPICLTLMRAAFGFRLPYDLLAAGLTNGLLQLGFVAAAVDLARSVRLGLILRDVNPQRLISRRVLLMTAACIAWFFAVQDLNQCTPDALLSLLLLEMVACTLRGLSRNSAGSFLLAGILAGLAFWTKSFAFSAVLLWLWLVAMSQWKKPRILGKLILFPLAFGLVAAPLIGLLSRAEGHFTVGTSGALNMAWYVNHADRFNPVQDSALYHSGSATAHFLHPGVRIAAQPESVSFADAISWGTVPQWDNPAYWSAGLQPQFRLRESLHTLTESARTLLLFALMRVQVLLLPAVVWLAGYRPGREARSLWTVMVFAMGCVGAYALVLLESRYIAFCAVLILVVWSAVAMRPHAEREAVRPDARSAEWIVLLLAASMLIFSVQDTLRSGRAEGTTKAHWQQSAQAWRAATSGPQEVACMSDALCWNRPLWAYFAGVRITTWVATGNGFQERSAAEGCAELESHPEVVERLRTLHLRAVVADFGTSSACSARWQPLGAGSGFYYLPLQ